MVQVEIQLSLGFKTMAFGQQILISYTHFSHRAHTRNYAIFWFILTEFIIVAKNRLELFARHCDKNFCWIFPFFSLYHRNPLCFSFLMERSFSHNFTVCVWRIRKLVLFIKITICFDLFELCSILHNFHDQKSVTHNTKPSFLFISKTKNISPLLSASSCFINK